MPWQRGEGVPPLSTADQPTDRPRPPSGDWLGSPYLRFERHGRVAWLIVDRPQARNALTLSMYFGIRYAADLVDHDESLSAMVITGTGDVFIPGGDLGHSAEDAWTDLSLFHTDATPFEVLRGMRKPIVSAVNGICQGGGLLIAMLSDVAVVSDRATFRAPELLRGISDMGYTSILPAMVGVARARDLLLSGRTLTAAEAEQWGMVTRVVPHDELYAQTRRAVVELGRAGPESRLDVRHALHQWFGHPDRGTMDRSLRRPESQEGYGSFKQRRKPDWTMPESDAPLPPWAGA